MLARVVIVIRSFCVRFAIGGGTCQAHGNFHRRRTRGLSHTFSGALQV